MDYEYVKRVFGSARKAFMDARYNYNYFQRKGNKCHRKQCMILMELYARYIVEYELVK